jgi:hypothetical protein
LIETTGEIPDGRLGHSTSLMGKHIVLFGGEKLYNPSLKMRECMNDVRLFSTGNI